MFKLDIVKRNKKFNKKFFFFNNTTKDIIFIKQIGLKKKVIEKIGFIDPITGITVLRFNRLMQIFYKYPGVILSPSFAKF